MSNGSLLVVVASGPEVPRISGVELLVCGVGKSAAAVETTMRLARGGVRAVVSFGVAGAYPRSGLEVGDVVVATEISVIDEGLECGDRFEPFERIGMVAPGVGWRATDPRLRAALVHGDAAFAVAEGRIATVSVCAGTTRLAEERGATDALAEGMEGAAIALAAACHSVPFAEVRGISNPCGPRDGAPFALAGPIANASRVLARLAEGAW